MAKTDLTKQHFVSRLNDFYWQFARLGNNYNQIVKQVNTHFSHSGIPTQASILAGYTRQLIALSEKIIVLSEEFSKQWSQE